MVHTARTRGLAKLADRAKNYSSGPEKKDEIPTNHGVHLPSLASANIMVEGGIVAYDSNVRTGGAGARYLGIGASGQYRTDQVTVNVRAVDVRSGRILLSVTTSKTILSKELQTGVFKFIDYKDLLEAELGYTTNEPVNLAGDVSNRCSCRSCGC